MAVEKRPIGKYLRRFRDAFRLKQKDVAEKIDVHPQLYMKYENDLSVPSVNVISSIAKIYNVTTDYLLGLSDEPRPWEAKAETSPPMEIDASTLKLIRALQEWRHEGQATA